MSSGPLGYGRYNDEPDFAGCPRARSDMTPCVARDGITALSGRQEPYRSAETNVCVGCGAMPRKLLVELAVEFPPARRYMQTHEPENCATRLREMVRAATEQPPLSPNTETRKT